MEIEVWSMALGEALKETRWPLYHNKASRRTNPGLKVSRVHF